MATATQVQDNVPHLREYDISRYMDRQPSQVVTYMCEGGRSGKAHEFTIRLHDNVEVEVPLEWQCAQHSVTAITAHLAAVMVDDVHDTKEKRRPSHLDTVLERRSPEELEAMVNEALTKLRSDREGVGEYLRRSMSTRDPVEVKGNLSNRRRRGRPVGVLPSV
ncbi:RNA polymerase-binding protein RbpA [Kutzneria chonburiensis]|uniref:RNA polymerase-binding protein RbpA n=1 Tax=Kutzneria chonburiensis TaxID=1483604 RepID=A0ABV6N342_9PSEU|nr:RNA polymerase-binding protein RbpA [Kutzneria chonburiensis]